MGGGGRFCTVADRGVISRPTVLNGQISNKA